MENGRDREDLIDLGSASSNTKGGPWGIDDHRQSLMLAGGGLTPD